MDEKALSIMKKQLRATRMLLFVMSAILAAVITFMILLAPPLFSAVTEIQELAVNLNEEVIPVLSSLDAEAFNEAVENLGRASAELDTEGLSRAAEELGQTISELNIEEFNSAVSSLNSTAEAFSKIGGIFF